MREHFGTVTIRSGALVVVDSGFLDDLGAALERHLAVTVGGVPNGEAFSVWGERVGGDVQDRRCWSDVYIEFAAGEPASSERVGDALVDYARLCLADPLTLEAWVHDAPLDGKADILWWGADEAKLAALMHAPRTDEGFGWRDLPYDEARLRGLRAEELKAAHGLRLCADLRPHSHNYALLARQRASPTDSGTIELAGACVTGFFTSWGDGLYPVIVDRDAHGKLLRVRIELAPDYARDAS